jgi:DNA-directed RNA polymerase-3 subunit RPC5
MPARVKSEPFPEEMEVVASTEDEIVREIDVYLSPALASQIHLLQYPLQHSQVAQPTQVRIKPRHGMLELDQPLSSAINREGIHDLTQRTFQSSIIPVQTHMCLGRMQASTDGSTAMHLVPLQHISQMRPSFRHVDEAAPGGSGADDDGADMMEEDKPVEKKPLIFHRKESERAATARKSSYAYKKASEDSEEWKVMSVHGTNSVEHGQFMRQTVCPTPKQTVWEAAQGDPSSAYVQSLNYLPVEADQVKAEVAPGRELATTVARLTTLLMRGWPIPFSILRSHFTPDVSNRDLLTALSVCAVLIRGNFTLHSKYLSLPKVLQKARTFMLVVLQTQGAIHRSRLDAVYESDTRVTSERLLTILEQLCQRTPAGWNLKIEDDLSFLTIFPEQATLHQQYWERQGPRFESHLEVYQSQ